MASVEELIIKLTADNTDLKAKMADSEKGVSKFGAAIKTIGPMIGGAFAVGSVIAFASAAFKAAEQQMQVNKRLLFSLKGNTVAFKELADQAENLRSATGVDDAAIMQIQTLGGAAGYSTDKIKKITAASVELAAVTGQDLQAAYMQVNATFNGSAGRLTRLDAEFGTLTESQLRNGDAVDLIIKKYEGFAANSATATQKLSSNWDEFTEKLGATFAPAFNSFFESINTNIDISNSKYLNFWERNFNGKRALELMKEGKAVEDNLNAWKEYDIKQSQVGFLKTAEGMQLVAEKTAEMRKNSKFLNAETELVTKEIKKQTGAIDDWVAAYEKSLFLQQYNVPQMRDGGGMTPMAGKTGVGTIGVKSKGISSRDTGLKEMDNFGDAAKRANEELEKQQRNLGAVAEMMGGIGTLAGDAFGEQSAAYQAFAIAQAIMSTYLAATAALAPPPMGYGPVAGIPAAIGITAMGLANVGKIVGAFAMGGIVGGGSYSGDNLTARVNSGEMILNGNQQRELFAMANGMGSRSQVEVVGYISGDVIRLANKRSEYILNRRG